MRGSHEYAFDARLEHRAAGLAALTADTTIDTVLQRAQTRTEFVTTIRIESIDIVGNDEEYKFVIECSNDSFTTLEVAAILSLGATEVREGGAPDNAAGDEYNIYWCTEVNGQSYKDWRIRLDVTGATTSLGFSCSSSKA